MVSLGVQHLEQDSFERYTLNQLARIASVRHEEHLLICEACQALQTKADEFVQLMKQVLSDQRHS
jgi:hypothetical protein